MHRAASPIQTLTRAAAADVREVAPSRLPSRRARHAVVPPAMTGWMYALAVAVGRFIFFCTVRLHLIRPDIPERASGYVLALTHLGNLDPFCASVLIRRRIWWMTRKEFFAWRPIGWLLRRFGAFSVNRRGVPVHAIRTAIALAEDGRVVGICPEGGRTRGADAAIRGAAIKRGVCSVAIRAQVPIVPCVILGTPALNAVGPWLPAKRGKLWVAYGRPIDPPIGPSTRASRDALRDELSRAYVRLYAELRERFDLNDADIE